MASRDSSGSDYFTPWVVVVLFLASLCSTAHGLNCYTCSSLEYESGSSSAKNDMSSKTDPHCENAGTIYGTKLESCDAPGLACGFVRTEASGKIGIIFGDTVKVRVLVRGCMPPIGSRDGCSPAGSVVSDLVNSKLGFLASVGGWNVDGKACYCSSDACIAGGCAAGAVPIAGQCFPWYYIIGFVVAATIALLLLTGCCCCCCCTCCKSKRPNMTTTVVMPSPLQPQSVQMNPYGYNQQAGK